MGILNAAWTDEQSCRQGKETEHNWMPREQSVIELRGMLKATLPADVRAALPPCVKSLSDGFIKAVSRLPFMLRRRDRTDLLRRL